MDEPKRYDRGLGTLPPVRGGRGGHLFKWGRIQDLRGWTIGREVGET